MRFQLLDFNVPICARGSSHTRLGSGLAGGDDDSMVIISAANDMGRRSLDRMLSVNDIGQGRDIGVNRVLVEGGNTVDVDVQTRDRDVDVLVEDVLETAKVEHGAGAVALDMLVEGLAGEEGLNLLGSGSHCKSIGADEISRDKIRACKRCRKA